MFVPVQSCVVASLSVVPGGQTKTPPAGAINDALGTAGEQPLPRGAASNSPVRRLHEEVLPNSVTVTQFWLGRVPAVFEVIGDRFVRAFVGLRWPPVPAVTERPGPPPLLRGG